MKTPAQQALARSDIALQAAKQRIKDEGISFPVWDKNEPHSAFYDRFQAYCEIETRYYLEALRASAPPQKPPEPKPQKKKEPAYHKPWNSYGERDD